MAELTEERVREIVREELKIKQEQLWLEELSSLKKCVESLNKNNSWYQSNKNKPANS